MKRLEFCPPPSFGERCAKVLHPRFVLALIFSLALPVATQSATLTRYPAVSIDWPSYNNDIASARYVNIDQINTSNVKRLHIVCAARLGGPNNFQTGPIVVGGVLYATRSNQTFAMNAATCKMLWVNTYRTLDVRQQARGAAYAGGLLFRGFSDGHVIAIDAANGAAVWNTLVVKAGSFEYIDAAPVVWNGTVIIGTSGGDFGEVCHVMALNQKSGRLRWSQQTVPDLGAPAASTWRGATHIGGGATWSSFTIDPATGKLYVPVGNPAPGYDIRDRLGRNLYTDAVLELDAATGTFERAMQFVPQDAHDWDQGAAPAVVMLRSGVKTVLVAGKDGYLRSVDLRTFDQRFAVAVTSIVNVAAPIVATGTHFCPVGAVLWNGPAYSPATGVTFVNSSDWCTTVDREATPEPYIRGQLWTGSSNYFGRNDVARSGWLRAFNAATGAALWKYHAPLPLIAGVTPTSGCLVFTADLAGNVLAFDAVSGALLKKVPTNLPVGGGVVSYAVSGTQYVAVAAGMTGNFQTPSVDSAIVVLGL